MPNPLLDAALKYADMGLSVIPVNPTMDERFEKQSFVEWKRFQKERPTKEQIKKWWEKWPAAMVGVVTGEVSNIFAVDGDNEEAEEQLENLIPENLCTPTTKSPHGKHVIFEYHPGIHNYNKNNGNVKFHVRGQGGYIIFPPSTRENGLRYEWLVSPDDIPFAPAPAALINIINKCIIGGYGGEGRNSDDKDHVTNVTRYFQDHQRDEHLFHAANCLVKGGG